MKIYFRCFVKKQDTDQISQDIAPSVKSARLKKADAGGAVPADALQELLFLF
jgi:hypothetical protein